jgi:hypothetical protein
MLSLSMNSERGSNQAKSSKSVTLRYMMLDTLNVWW